MTVWFFDVGEITYLPVFTGQITRLMSRESCDIYCNKTKQRKIMTAQWQPSVIMFRAPYMTESPTPK